MTKCPHCGHDDADDPFNLDYRLQQWADDWSHLVENRSPKITLREVNGFISAVNGVRKDLRKGKKDDGDAGSAVRKYSKEFADAGRRRSHDTGAVGAAYNPDESAGLNGPAGPPDGDGIH